VVQAPDRTKSDSVASSHHDELCVQPPAEPPVDQAAVADPPAGMQPFHVTSIDWSSNDPASNGNGRNRIMPVYLVDVFERDASTFFAKGISTGEDKAILKEIISWALKGFSFKRLYVNYNMQKVMQQECYLFLTYEEMKEIVPAFLFPLCRNYIIYHPSFINAHILQKHPTSTFSMFYEQKPRGKTDFVFKFA
jgi:hypothetical protein